MREHHLNVFLVILNAEMKFRQYLHTIGQQPPATPLPVDVLNLMDRTVHLVNLLYWRPTLTEGSRGEAVLAEETQLRRTDPTRAARPDKSKTVERGPSEEEEMVGDGDEETWDNALSDVDAIVHSRTLAPGFAASNIISNLIKSLETLAKAGHPSSSFGTALMVDLFVV